MMVKTDFGTMDRTIRKASRLRDRPWARTIKWHLAKTPLGKPAWATRYLFDQLVRSLTPRDTVIDCGANVGDITRELAATGATVHAFEPDPHAFSRLCRNTAEFSSVIRHNQAVGAGAAKVNLYRMPDFDERPDIASTGSSIFSDKVNVSEGNFVEVEQIDLASFIHSLGHRVRIVKMDIEGTEVPLLEHLIETGVLDHVDMVVAETHETRIPALADRTARLRQIAARDYQGKLYLDWH